MTGLPLSHDDARRAAAAVLDHPGADAVEVVVTGTSRGLTRFANSEIIQSTLCSATEAGVRVVVGGRVASASTDRLDPDDLARAARRAIEAAGASPVDEEFPGLPDPGPVGRPEPVMRLDEATVATDERDRAAAVREILSVTSEGGAAGAFETGSYCFAVFNSNGIDCYDAYSRCAASVLADLDDGTGWGEASSHSVADVDVAAVARTAIDKARAGHSPAGAVPGDYEIVLEPPAAATLVSFLAGTVGAKAVIEGQSFLSTRCGELVASPSVTVADDARHPDSVGIGFDFEGSPRRRVPVIDAGRATGPVTDLRTAARLGTEVTGHSSGSVKAGPYAANPVVEAGEQSLEDLIGAVEHGLLVTRFHYANVLDRPTTLLTGMTRDGLFGIENGEVRGPTRNMRFTQSVLGALSAVQGVGAKLLTVPPRYGVFGSAAAPALRIGSFSFTSAASP